MASGKQSDKSSARANLNPFQSLLAAAMDSSVEGPSSTSSIAPGQKKRKNKPYKQKKRNRRQSFAAPDHAEAPDMGAQIPSLLDVPENAATESQFARIGGRRTSDTSLESEALLDHR